jgi:hypothetical protein
MHKSALINGNAAALLIADFTSKFISQSTPSQHQSNTISITIATRASLLAEGVLEMEYDVAQDRSLEEICRKDSEPFVL